MTASVHPDVPPNRAPAESPAAPAASASVIRSWLFTRYDALLVAVVGVTLLSGGVFEVFSHYREHRSALIRIQHEQAKAAAAKIGQFIEEVEGQLGWTTQLPWSGTEPENRRFDALRLLRQVPAITELMLVDQTGKERLRVSRLTMDVVDSGNDFSQDPKFTEAVAHRVYYGPVYFRRDSEPYMTLALAGSRKDAGVSIAEVNLKLIWDIVSQVKVGEHGHAYVVSARGRLIAHPDMGLVLRNTDMSKLVQVQAAQANTDVTSDALEDGQDILGQEVLTASAPIRPLRWIMFVERPVAEAYVSLYAALQRMAIVLAAALVFTTLVGMFLTRRLLSPIEALRAGVEQIGGGDLVRRLSVAAGGEAEGVARSSAKDARYALADPENEVERHTVRSIESLQRELTASEVLKVVNRSASGLQAVFDSVVEDVARLCSADGASIDQKTGDRLQRLASCGRPEGFAAGSESQPVGLVSVALDTVGLDTVGLDSAGLARGSIVGQALNAAKSVQVLDVLADPELGEFEAERRAGFRTMLAVPLMREGEPIGVLVLTRTDPQLFDETQIELVAAFADLAAMIIENAALLGELREHAKALSPLSDPAFPGS
jgi:GAF domain-containing protein